MIDSSNIGGLQRARVIDTEGGKIGSVGQVYLDSDSGRPAWVTVRTGLFGTSETFVPLADATFEGEDVVVPFDKGVIKDAPRIDADGMLTPDQERALYRYYGAEYGNDDADSAADDRAEREVVEQEREAKQERRTESNSERPDAPHSGTHASEGSRMRLRKYVVVEQQTFTVPVRREELRLERETAGDDRENDAEDDSRDDEPPPSR